MFGFSLSGSNFYKDAPNMVLHYFYFSIVLIIVMHLEGRFRAYVEARLRIRWVVTAQLVGVLDSAAQIV